MLCPSGYESRQFAAQSICLNVVVRVQSGGAKELAQMGLRTGVYVYGEDLHILPSGRRCARQRAGPGAKIKQFAGS
jgi:hypothetical protein